MRKLQVDEEKKKKWDNFWYYYKYHVLGGVFALFCLFIFIRDLWTRVDYDYTVGFLGEYSLSEEDSESLQKWFEENGEDLNGDGEVQVQIADYPLPDGETGSDPQFFVANQTKFMADIQEGTSMLFFLNEGNYERFKKMDVFPADREQVQVKDCEGFRQTGNPISIQDMVVSMRLISEDSKMAADEEKQNYYKASEKLLKKFIGE